MRVFAPRTHPPSFAEGRAQLAHGWLLPLFAVEWCFEWVAYFLSNWKFLEVLEYLSSLSVLVAVLFYFSESGDRTKQKHYQAWQVVNTAQGKGGSGGRLEALQELNVDGVQLVGVDVSGAFLQGIRLQGARLVRSNFSAADLRNSDFRAADFSNANLHSANLRDSLLQGTQFQDADLGDADLTGADLRDAVLSNADLSQSDWTGAKLDKADLRNADVRDARWQNLASIQKADLRGVKHPPDGFLAWAQKNGAIVTSTSRIDEPASK